MHNIIKKSKLTRLLYLILLPKFIILTSSFVLPNVENSLPSHINDPNYDSFENDYPLYKYDNEDNMLPPKLFNLDTGSIKFGPNSKYIYLTTNNIYTFVFYIKDYKDLIKDNLIGNNYFEYFYKTVGYNENSTYRSYLPSKQLNSFDFLNYYKNDIPTSSVPVIKLSEDYSKIFISINTDNIHTNLIKIMQFNLIFNSKKSSGIISLCQLYKGDISSYKGYSAFNHAPYGLNENIVGPFKDKTEINLTIPYKENQISVDDIKSNILAFDKGDYEYKQINIIQDSFTLYKRILNKPLKIVFKASDSFNNYSTITFNITIVDNSPPIIIQLNENIKYSYKAIINKENILSNFSIKDDYSYKVDTSITGIDLNKTNKLGKYNITIKSIDFSNNISTFDSTIEIVDDIPPIIDGPSYINANVNELLNEEEILKQFNVTDDIDKNPTLKIIENEYKNNYQNVGEYTLTLQANDSNNNETKKTIQINVVDDDGPIFYLNKTQLTMYEGDKINTTSLIKNLIKSNILSNKNYVDIAYTSSSIQENISLPYGEHQLLLTCKSDDNQIQYITLNINVISKVKNNNIFLNIINKIIEFFHSILKKFNI